MFTIPTQLSQASKTSLQAQLAIIAALTGKAFEGMEKFVGLNLDTAKSSLDESNAAVKQFFAAKDIQEWLALSVTQTQPAAEKALAYGRQLADIASGVQAEFTKAAEEQLSETSRKVLELVEEVTRLAPAGSENAVAFFKSAIGSANAGYEQFSKTAKQAAETLEANLNTAASQFSQPAAKAAGRASAKK